LALFAPRKDDIAVLRRTGGNGFHYSALKTKIGESVELA